MERIDTARALAQLGAAFRVEIASGQAEVWHEHLADLPAEMVALEVDAWILHQAKFPTIAEIRELVSTKLKSRRQAEREAEMYRALPPVPDTAEAKERVAELKSEIAQLSQSMQKRTEEVLRPITFSGRLAGCSRGDHTNCGWDASGEIPLAAARDAKKAKADKAKKNKPDGVSQWAMGRAVAHPEEESA